MDYRWRRGGLTISALTPGREDWLRDLAESSCIVRHDVRDSLFFLLIQILELTQQLSGVTVEQYEVYSWSSVAAFTIYAHLLTAWDADLWWKVSKDFLCAGSRSNDYVSNSSFTRFFSVLPECGCTRL